MEAILREAENGYDLVVMGVTRRAGEVPAFGPVPDAVLDKSPRSVLLVAT